MVCISSLGLLTPPPSLTVSIFDKDLTKRGLRREGRRDVWWKGVGGVALRRGESGGEEEEGTEKEEDTSFRFIETRRIWTIYKVRVW